MFRAEREFVKTVKACLDGLTHADCDLQVTHLETIAAGAKSVQARAVMIGAQRCMPPAREGRLLSAFELRTLTRLAGQFEDGLLEIDPGAAEETPADIIVMDAASVEFSDFDDLATAQDGAAEISAPQTQHDIAAATLKNVLPFAPREHRPALTCLMNYARGVGAVNIQTPQAKPVSLEGLIAPVTSRALISAHRAHKQVSLSYACENIAVPAGFAPALQDLLVSLCDGLIDLSMRCPAVRESAGLPATGQIAFTASETARGLTLDVFCDDLAVTQDELNTGRFARALTAFQAAGGSAAFKDGRKTGVMICITHSLQTVSQTPSAPAQQAARLREVSA